MRARTKRAISAYIACALTICIPLVVLVVAVMLSVMADDPMTKAAYAIAILFFALATAVACKVAIRRTRATIASEDDDA